MKMPPLVLRKTVLDKLTMDFFLFSAFNKCMQKSDDVSPLYKKKIINGVRQYSHCCLPLESEPMKSGNVWMGEKFPIEAFLKLLSAVLLWCSALKKICY